LKLLEWSIFDARYAPGLDQKGEGGVNVESKGGSEVLKTGKGLISTII